MLNRLNLNVPFHLTRTQSLELPHSERYRDAALALLGIDATGQLAVEVAYRATDCTIDSDDQWVAQFLFDADGRLLEYRDEECGRNAAFDPFVLSGYTAPEAVSREITHIFEYSGARWHGLRDTDRIPDVLQPMSVAEKVALAARNIPGPILGIAESRVNAVASVGTQNFDGSDLMLVCRRLRIAYAVSLQRDAQGLPYDYDTIVLFLGHVIDPNKTYLSAPSLADALTSDIIGIAPMDALFDVHNATLYVADGGDATHPAAIHRLHSDPIA